MKMKRFVALVVSLLAVCFVFVGCGKEPETKKDFMFVTEYPEIEDDSFLSLSYSAFSDRKDKANVSYKTTAATSTATATINAAIAASPDILWGADYSFGDTFKGLCADNPDILFAVTDYVITGTAIPSNLLAIEFKAEEAAFLAGYAAAKTDDIDTIGFIGGEQVTVIENMAKGFYNGARYAASEEGFTKTMTYLDAEYVGSFNKATTAETMATTMYNAGADVIFQAAGSGGFGVFDAAVELDKWAIGVDYDQKEYAPDNILTCVLKKVDRAIGTILDDYLDGESVGGKNYTFNIANEGVGISAGNLKNTVFLSVAPLMVQIANGTINVLANAA